MNRTLLFILLLACGVSRAASAETVDFSRDVRPILSQHCFKCHGPDTQKGGLRLDEAGGAHAMLKSGKAAIVPGRPHDSELVRRIATSDVDDVMPPTGGGNVPLTPAQIATLKRWIEAGGEYRKHWAYVPPVRPAVEAGVHPIDSLVRARLREAGLEPSPPASLETLCRRLHLDLTGLPPTPAEVRDFVDAAKKDRASAIAARVDRLLASPAFGEKWARHWLDLARYGDTAGYQHDDEMPLWLWRDWVINAINDDMPFTQFTVEQIAGDLLPGATDQQKIATGFHRAATVTLGADQNVDELRAQLVWDRVNTVGTTWLATSLECAQCHTHKFDPVPLADYYSMYAYFNTTVPELTKEPGSHYFITGGVLELPVDEARQQRVAAIKAEMTKVIAQMVAVPLDEKSMGGATIRRIVQGPPSFREPERVYYYLAEELKGPGPAKLASYISRLRRLGAELRAVLPPRALVLQEDAAPPATHVFLRGNVRTPGDLVTPRPLSALHPLPADAPANRLGLAQWLVSRDNPLTARVVVNRWWTELFGEGIVRTTEDFGLQGESPSHPELLDWLAVEFMDSGWSMKRLLRTIVLSETYQQSSSLTPDRLARDPENRLLSRGPRFRLDAESLRDNALAIAGLLDETAGGPPTPARPQAGRGDEANLTASRRSIYLRHRRGDPYTTFTTLDAPDRFACSTRRVRTNTPLQALTLLNEPVFVAAARGLAQRTLRESPDATFEARARFMFTLCTSREPTPEELALLQRLHHRAASSADAPAEDRWLLLANVMLNLDETLTKE